MASEALVDLSYRGLVLGKRVRLLQVGPQSAYVAHDTPMPVGTELVLTVDETLAIPAQVARVREGDSKDGPTGMWLWADAAEQRARAWWDAHVTAEDPLIPEPVGGRVRTEAPVAPAAEPTPAAAAAPAPAPAAAAEHAAIQNLAGAKPSEQPLETAPAAMSSEPQPDLGPGDADAGDTSQEIVAASVRMAADLDDRDVGQSDHQADQQPDYPSDALAGEQPDVLADEQPDDENDEQLASDTGEDDYAVEIGRAATNVDPEYAGGDASDADEEALDLPRGNTHGRQPRGTQVMTAVEIADVLGMPPVLDSIGDGEAPERAGRAREVRTTTVMSAVELADVLGSGGASEPEPEPPATDDGSAKGKGRKRRGRKRR